MSTMENPMHQLFAEAIRSPAPLPEPRANPFELHFASAVATSAPSTHGPTSASAPSSGSYQSDHWLTQHSSQQQPQQSDSSAHFFTHGERQNLPLRRRGGPRLLFMGMRRCGKSSIQKVVFEKLAPPDTLYLEATNQVETASMQSFVPFESSEIPSHVSILSPDYDHSPLFSAVGAVIWIIDSQDEYLSSINELLRTAVFLSEHYPRINLEVFIHKTDGLSDEYKYDTFREVRQRVQDELSDIGYGTRAVSYYQTSIFDHSVFEAMSKVVQKLLPQLPAMETLLNKLCSTCRIQKAYLFDTTSKIYVATDASPTFLRDYEVCADYVDVIVDIKQLYGWRERKEVVGSRPGSAAGADEKQQVSSNAAIGESIVTYDRTGDTYIYVREINEYLSLLCLMSKGSSADKRVLIDYNVDILQDALQQIFKV